MLFEFRVPPKAHFNSLSGLTADLLSDWDEAERFIYCTRALQGTYHTKLVPNLVQYETKRRLPGGVM